MSYLSVKVVEPDPEVYPVFDADARSVWLPRLAPFVFQVNCTVPAEVVVPDPLLTVLPDWFLIEKATVAPPIGDPADATVTVIVTV
jgi:hypothetical protein